MVATRLYAASLVVLAACSRSEVDAACATVADDQPAPPPAPACAVDHEHCTPIGSPVRMTRYGITDPELVFNGREVLVLSDGACGEELAAVSLDGDVLWVRRLSGGAPAHLAWHPAQNVGIAITGRTLWRLDADGKPQSALPLDASAMEAFAERSGLSVVLDGPTPRYASLASLPTTVPFAFAASEFTHQIPDPDGVTNFLVTSVAPETPAELWSLATGMPERFPTGTDGWGRIIAAVELGGEAFTLAVGITDQPGGRSVLLLKSWGVTPAAGKLDVFITAPTATARYATLFSLNGQMMAVSANLDQLDAAPLGFAAVDALATPDHIGPATALNDGQPLLQAPAAVATSRGFAVVWTEADGDVPTTQLQLVECCL